MSPQRTSTTMELLPLVCLCLLSCSGDAVRVEEGSDAVLPCLISNKDLEGKFFDWKKDGQKEVFLYDAGNHYKNGRPGQDEQFKGRVEHFQDQLQNGNASIKITRTKMADSGNYSCDFPRLQPRQTFIIELVVDPRVKVVVKEGSDAVLPCLISTKENLTGELFDWKKDGQDVFIHYSSSDTKGLDRVSHFKNEQQNGDASIKITNTKMADSGIYSCHFPDLHQTFYIKLVVGQVLSDRTDENIPGPPIGWIVAGVLGFLLLVVGVWRYKKRRDKKKKLLRMPNARPIPEELHHLECSTPAAGKIIFDEKVSEPV